MDERVHRYLDELHKGHTMVRRKVPMAELEDRLKAEYGEAGAYQKAGGYGRLVQVVTELVRAGRLEPVKSAGSNGRQPVLRTMYWSLPVRDAARWSDTDIVRVSDRLNMAAYLKQPCLQTDEEWQRIERVYAFLSSRDRREWVTREERSLELFGSEKWLSEEQGAQLLRRIGVTLDDMKAKVHGEPFVFWSRPGIRLQQAEAALVVENLSLFHTVRRVLETDGQVLGLQPDLLIYGEGKKIEASLTFLNDIADSSKLTILYAGDIDPEGWSIYTRLKMKYADHKIGLAAPVYEAMAQIGTTVPIGQQWQEESVLRAVLDELNDLSCSDTLAIAIKRCWQERLRIPQEVLTVETLRAARGWKKDVTTE